MTHTSPQTSFTNDYHVSPQLLVAFLIFILTTITYINMLNHPFLGYDDGRIIVPRSETFNAFTLKNIKNIVLDDYPREEPLIVRDLSYLINGSIFGGDNPQGYLLGNLLLHMMASYLVFSLSLVLFPHRYWQAILTAVLFAVHPIHVESIAWISSRKDSLYSCFFLSGFLSYDRFTKTNNTGMLLLSLVLYLLALFSKSSAIAFLPVALLYRLLFASKKKWGRQEIIYFATATVLSYIFMRWYSSVLTTFGLFELQNGTPLLKQNPATWILLNLEVITFYLGKLLYPKTFSITYEFPTPQNLFVPLPFFILSLITCAVLLYALSIFMRMKDKRPLFLMLWFLLVLGPYLNLAGIYIYEADRYLYLAAFSPIITFSYLLTTLMAKIDHQGKAAIRGLSFLFVCLLIGGLISRSIRAVEVWATTETLWTNALAISPNRMEPYTALISVAINDYCQKKETAEGKKALQRAKNIANQGYQKFCGGTGCQQMAASLMYQIANIYYQEDQLAKAEQFLKQGLLLKPDDIPLNYLGTYVAIKQGDLKEAEEGLEFLRHHANPNLYAGMDYAINTNIPQLIERQKKAPSPPSMQ